MEVVLTVVCETPNTLVKKLKWHADDGTTLWNMKQNVQSSDGSRRRAGLMSRGSLSLMVSRTLCDSDQTKLVFSPTQQFSTRL